MPDLQFMSIVVLRHCEERQWCGNLLFIIWAYKQKDWIALHLLACRSHYTFESRVKSARKTESEAIRYK